MYSVEITEIYSHFFHESNVFLKKLLKKLISRKYFDFQVKQMAKSMGINSPIFMFDDDDENKPKKFVPKSVKRSSRRTTMLPPELNRTLNGTFTGKFIHNAMKIFREINLQLI